MQLRIWGSEVRILSGAPFACKTTNIVVRGTSSRDRRRKDGRAPDYSNGMVVDFHGRHDRMDECLLRVDVAVAELSHILVDNGLSVRRPGLRALRRQDQAGFDEDPHTRQR